MEEEKQWGKGAGDEEWVVSLGEETPVLGEPDHLGEGRGQKVRVCGAPRMGGCGFEGVDLGLLALDGV